MTSQSAVRFGAACMALYSFSITGQLVLNQLMDDADMPIWKVMFLCEVITLGPNLLWCWKDRVEAPSLQQLKWLALRACFVCLSLILATLGVRISRAPGDVNALTSINVVAASAIGHIVLNERLRWMHALAVLCSFAGAMLISKPEFLFGVPPAGASLFLGYVFALMSGLSRAVAMVCARKPGKVPVSYMSASTTSSGLLMFLLLPMTPLLESRPLGPVLSAPGLAALSVAGNLLSMVVSTIAGSTGSMLCPAVVSATIFTASGMLFGYISQVLLFDTAPDAVTLAGAALMLLAVVVMTMFRVKIDTPEAADDPAASEAASTEDQDVSDDESLFSFAAAEFAEFEAHASSPNPSLRLRRLSAAPPQPLGVLAGASSSVVIGACSVLPVASS